MMPAKLSQIGEFGLIELLKKYQSPGPSVVRGMGDDTAVVPLDAKRYLLLTTDMLIEGGHFTLKAAPRAIGHKALACSISDIAAMGGAPRYALVSLGVSPGLPVAFIRGIYEGMHQLAKQYNVAIVGGDTIKSDKLVINVALTGEADKKDIVYRSGARVGDHIFVTGALGKSLPTGWHLKFMPRVKESQYLIRHAKPNAMIDISDGLAADLGHILEQSKVGAVLDKENIPRRAGASLREALYNGEDFELLFTVSVRQAAVLSKQKKIRVYPIGKIVERAWGLRIEDNAGKVQRIIPHGYTHF